MSKTLIIDCEENNSNINTKRVRIEKTIAIAPYVPIVLSFIISSLLLWVFPPNASEQSARPSS